MRELSHQIDTHVVVLDGDNPTTTTPSVTQGVTQPALGSNPPVTSEAPLIDLVTPGNPNAYVFSFLILPYLGQNFM